MSIILLRPWWLLALLPLGYLLWRGWQRNGYGYSLWTKVIDPHLFPHVLQRTTGQSYRLKIALSIVGAMLLVLALSGPAIENTGQQTQQVAPLQILLVDLSGQGETPEQAKHFTEQLSVKLLSLLPELPIGQVALIAYAGESYLIVPPTLDVATIAHFVPELLPEVMPVAGNQPEKGWHMAQALFDRINLTISEQPAHMLWITNATDAVTASLPLNTKINNNLRISILHGASVPAPELTQIAERSGGEFIKMRPDNSDLQYLLNQMNGNEQLMLTGRDYKDLGYWLLLPLLVIVSVLFRYQVLSIVMVPSLSIILLATALYTPQTVSAGEISDNFKGWWLMMLGDHQQAAEKFSKPDWQAIAYYRSGNYVLAAKLLAPYNDANSLFNRGNALARMGNYTQALRHYERSLTLKFTIETQENRDLMKKLLNSPQQTAKNKQQNPNTPPKRKPNNETEAERVANQWLQGVPEEPAKLLKLKLAQEQKRRESGKIKQ